jgi:hypothetical protein
MKYILPLTSTGGDFEDYQEKDEDKEMYYVLCFNKTTPMKDLHLDLEKVKKFKDGNCLESRLLLSSIEFEDVSNLKSS